MGIADNSQKYVQRHIKKKVKKEVIKTPLSYADQTVGTQANPLDHESGASSQQMQWEQVKSSQPMHKLLIKIKHHAPSFDPEPPCLAKTSKTQSSYDPQKRKGSKSDSDHAPKPKKPTIRAKPF